MKAIILAGGSGDRLWPLSRREYPKQFIINDFGKSLFQETITRNLPYCDSFCILIHRDYVPVVAGQLQQFQSLDYTLVEESRMAGTAVAIARAVKDCHPDEMVIVLPSDLMIGQEGYSDAVYAAREKAEQGTICLLGTAPKSPSTDYGYIRFDEDGRAIRFMEKPSVELARTIFAQDNILWHSGIFVAKAGILQQEYRIYGSEVYDAVCGGGYEGTPLSFDRLILEQSRKVSVVRMTSDWEDVSDYAAYIRLNHLDEKSDSYVIRNNSPHTTVVNQTPNQLIVTNGVENLLIVSTPDAIYVTDKQSADDIRGIMKQNYDRYENHFERSPLVYRPWGFREVIRKEPGFRIRKIMMYPGMKISTHRHERRTETYSVIAGELMIELGADADQVIRLEPTMSYSIKPGTIHQLRNDTDDVLLMLEVDTGAEIDDWDFISDKMEEGRAKSAQADAEPGEANDSPAQLPTIYKMSPAFKDYLWGGDSLKRVFGKDSPYEITAESWELSAHPDGQSVIDDGPFAGRKFGDFVGEYGRRVCGWKSDTFDRFPVLIKFIDARNALSVQIHPDDDYAFKNENEFGKNEMWYVVNAAPGAYLYCGLARETTKEELRQRIADNTLTDVLNKIEVHPGDVIFVPAGTIHAICPGILICEIQQNSNCTYRMYDYGRIDKNGKPRALHVEKALDVVNTAAYLPKTRGEGEPVIYDRSTQRLLSQCKYFKVVEYDIDEHEIIQVDESSFKSIVIISGECTIKCGPEEYEAKPGDSFFIACGRKRVHVTGSCTLLLTSI